MLEMNIVYMNMKRLQLLLMLLLPLSLLFADNGKNLAVSVLDKAVQVMKSDAGVSMEFTYTVSDANGDALFNDKGYFCLDKNPEANTAERYTLQMQQLRIWCNGERQWNYMAQTNEIYITAADSEEAQSLSPLYLMQLYKSGLYQCSLQTVAGKDVITLRSTDSATDFTEIKVWLSTKNSRLTRLQMVTADGSCAQIVIDDYKSGCSFKSGMFECPIGEYRDAEVIDMF